MFRNQKFSTGQAKTKGIMPLGHYNIKIKTMQCGKNQDNLFFWF